MTSQKIIIPPFTKKGPDGIPEGIPPEELERLQKIQLKLTDFILHLIQAFLRTGYYTPEHPESKKAKEGLYKQFKDLFEAEDEVSFLVKEEPGGQEVFIEGLLPEPQRLSKMMMKGMGELYVPRFAKFMERKDLISLTLKSQMSQEEFTQFIDIMSEPSLVDTRRKEDKDRFIQALYKRGIFNISYIFNEEMLAPEREIPWRARLVLSRMKKDLKMIPLYQRISNQEIQLIQRNLLRDALRPIRQSDLLCSILRNSDLASTSDFREEMIEDEIISFLQRQYLINTSRIFLKEHINLKQLKKGDSLEKKSDRLVKKIARRLKEVGTKETEIVLEEFFRNQLINLEDLTPSLKDKIILEKLTDKFLSYTDQFFQKLDQAKEKEVFLTVAQSFLKMIPELIRRERYTEILRIIETLKRHFHQKMMWALLAGQILEEISKGPLLNLLEERFLSGKKEIRALISPIFVALEVGAIPYLLSILKKSEDQWVRKNACEALIQIGPVATATLLKELEFERTSLETTIDILKVLGEIKSHEWKPSLTKILEKYASHENPKLREQALYTLLQIKGVEAEDSFIARLDDPDIEVKKRAIWCLGMIKSKKGLEKMLEILRESTDYQSPTNQQLENQIYHAFGLFGNLTIGEETLEKILIGVLEKRGIKHHFGFFQKDLLPDTLLITIFETLAKIGTKESIQVLNRLKKSRQGPWLSKLNDSIIRIETRLKEKPSQ